MLFPFHWLYSHSHSHHEPYGYSHSHGIPMGFPTPMHTSNTVLRTAPVWNGDCSTACFSCISPRRMATFKWRSFCWTTQCLWTRSTASPGSRFTAPRVGDKSVACTIIIIIVIIIIIIISSSSSSRVVAGAGSNWPLNFSLSSSVLCWENMHFVCCGTLHWQRAYEK